MQEQLYRQSRHDPLTGLPNRRFLLEHIERCCGSADPGDLIGLCFLDVDGFKRINDRHGHAVGDRVLIDVADRMRHALPQEYMIARIGGDEFVAFLPAPVATGAVESAAEMLLQSFATPIVVDDLPPIAVSASVGALLAPRTTRLAEQLLDASDRALYYAKSYSAGRWVLHTAGNDHIVTDTNTG